MCFCTVGFYLFFFIVFSINGQQPARPQPVNPTPSNAQLQNLLLLQRLQGQGAANKKQPGNTVSTRTQINSPQLPNTQPAFNGQTQGGPPNRPGGQQPTNPNVMGPNSRLNGPLQTNNGNKTNGPPNQQMGGPGSLPPGGQQPNAGPNPNVPPNKSGGPTNGQRPSQQIQIGRPNQSPNPENSSSSGQTRRLPNQQPDGTPEGNRLGGPPNQPILTGGNQPRIQPGLLQPKNPPIQQMGNQNDRPNGSVLPTPSTPEEKATSSQNNSGSKSKEKKSTETKKDSKKNSKSSGLSSHPTSTETNIDENSESKSKSSEFESRVSSKSNSKKEKDKDEEKSKTSNPLDKPSSTETKNSGSSNEKQPEDKTDLSTGDASSIATSAEERSKQIGQTSKSVFGTSKSQEQGSTPQQISRPDLAVNTSGHKIGQKSGMRSYEPEMSEENNNDKSDINTADDSKISQSKKESEKRNSKEKEQPLEADSSSEISSKNKIEVNGENNVAGLLLNSDEDVQENDSLIKPGAGSGARLISREDSRSITGKAGLNYDESIDVENVRGINKKRRTTKRINSNRLNRNRLTYPAYNKLRRKKLVKNTLRRFYGTNSVDQELLLPIVGAGQGNVLPPVHRGISEELEKAQKKTPFYRNNVY